MAIMTILESITMSNFAIESELFEINSYVYPEPKSDHQ